MAQFQSNTIGARFESVCRRSVIFGGGTHICLKLISGALGIDLPTGIDHLVAGAGIAGAAGIVGLIFREAIGRTMASTASTASK